MVKVLLPRYGSLSFRRTAVIKINLQVRAALELWSRPTSRRTAVLCSLRIFLLLLNVTTDEVLFQFFFHKRIESS